MTYSTRDRIAWPSRSDGLKGELRTAASAAASKAGDASLGTRAATTADSTCPPASITSESTTCTSLGGGPAGNAAEIRDSGSATATSASAARDESAVGSA